MRFSAVDLAMYDSQREASLVFLHVCDVSVGWLISEAPTPFPAGCFCPRPADFLYRWLHLQYNMYSNGIFMPTSESSFGWSA